MATSYLKKAAGKLFRKARGRERRSDSTQRPEIFFLCDSCNVEISEGSLRFHCCECDHSYDLCQLCYEDKDKAHEHQQKLGKDHIFSIETQAPFRLVDNAVGDSLEQTFNNVFRLYPTRPVLGQYIPSKQCYEYISYSQLEQYVKQFASGLHRLVLPTTAQQQDGKAGSSYNTMVALCSVCRMEWYVCDLACLFLGIPTVGITASCDKNTIAYILNQTECAVAVCSIDLLSLFVSLAHESCCHLKHIIVMDMKEGEDVKLSEDSISADVNQLTMSSVMSGGEDNQIDLKSIKSDPSSVFTIAYTSGSTGAPKGCVFTRHTWNCRITRTHANFRKVWFSFSPPSHLLERRNLHAILVAGGRSGIYRGSMEHLFTDIAMVRPTIVAGTPRFYTIIYNQYLQALHVAYREYQESQPQASENVLGMIESTSATEDKEHTVHVDGEMADNQDTTPTAAVPETISRALSRAISVASEADEGLESSDPVFTGVVGQDDVAPVGFNPDDVPWKVKEVVMKQFKNVLGGREIAVSIGGAAVDPVMRKFIETCFNGLTQEGYGTTEAGGIAFQDIVRTGVDLKLIDVPEMGYLTTDKPPRGEICVKSSDNISGYYKNPEETAAKFVDGYFRTGDIGVQLASDKIRIIDRKKNLFKLAQGEFVAPERIEGLFENSSLIEQVYVYGNVHQTNVVAVVVPYREALLEWWKRKENHEEVFEADYDALCTLQSTNHLYLTELQRIGKQQELQGWEIPPAIILEPNPFSAENGLLTSTLKKSRPQLEKRYKAQLEELYLTLGSNMGNRPLELQVIECLRHLLSSRGVAVSGGPTVSPPLSLSLTLTQLGGDSLAAMRVSSLIQEAFCTDVSAQYLLKHALIDVYHFILSQLLPSHQPSLKLPSESIDINWEDEVDVSFLKDVAHIEDRESDEEGEIVLLTGASGFLGRFILWELLHNESCRTVYCICREGDGVSATDRIMNLLHTIASELHMEDSVAQFVDSKLVVLAGDLSKPCLGVSEESYVTLQRKVSLIVHCGAIVNSVLPYDALKEANVCSTQQLLSLCLQGRPKAIHYVSTVGVFASLQWETLGEHSHPDPNRLHHLSGYSQSKWVAEQTVMKASKVAGITSSISRPGLVGPHSVTGHPNTRDWFYLLVTGIYRLGCYPTGPGCDEKKIPMVPVDTVAKGVVYLAMNTKTESSCQGVFHLVNSSRDNAVSFYDLVENIRMFKPLDETDYSTFKALLSQQARDTNDPVLSSLNLVLPQQGGLPRSQFFTSDLASSLLSSIGLDLTVLPQHFMSIYIEYLLDKGYIP